MSITNTLRHAFRETTWNIPRHLSGDITRIHSQCYLEQGADGDNAYCWLESESDWNGGFDLRAFTLPTLNQPTSDMQVSWLQLNADLKALTIETLDTNMSAQRAMERIILWEALHHKNSCHGDAKLFSKRPIGTNPINKNTDATPNNASNLTPAY